MPADHIEREREGSRTIRSLSTYREHASRQSERLHREMAGSEFVALPGLGHMIHHLAPDAVVSAIDRVAERSLA
jgi:pimeloyl-ACP methyl ester carboxylesterase